MTPLDLSDRVVAASARGLTRRRILRNASGVALGGVVATAYAFRTPAEAGHCSSSSYSGPCGPSPLCGPCRCNGYRCVVPGSSGCWQQWSCYVEERCCADSGVRNCWCEGSYRCCDCCAYDPGCKDTACSTSSCGGNYWVCICRGSC
jgi:hypothetical protein